MFAFGIWHFCKSLNVALYFVPHRREAFSVHLGKLWQTLCKVWWAGKAQKNSHWRETVCLPSLWAAFHEIRSLDKACKKTYDSKKGSRLAAGNEQTQPGGYQHATRIIKYTKHGATSINRSDNSFKCHASEFIVLERKEGNAVKSEEQRQTKECL